MKKLPLTEVESFSRSKFDLPSGYRLTEDVGFYSGNTYIYHVNSVIDETYIPYLSVAKEAKTLKFIFPQVLNLMCHESYLPEGKYFYVYDGQPQSFKPRVYKTKDSVMKDVWFIGNELSEPIAIKGRTYKEMACGLLATLSLPPINKWSDIEEELSPEEKAIQERIRILYLEFGIEERNG